MSVSAAHFQEVTNGYEKRSDGLWVHTGKLSVGPPGTASGSQAGDLSVNRGNSQGAIYFGGMGAAQYIYWDGTKWVFQPALTGAAIADGSITSADIADGTIQTADLAVGAAQALIGSFVGNVTFSSTATGAWLTIPLSTGSIACTGALVRIECSTTVFHSAAGGFFWTTIMIDGGAGIALTSSSALPSGAQVPISWTYYTTPTAGNHTYSFTIYNHIAGTVSINSTITSTLYVTEQRR